MSAVENRSRNRMITIEESPVPTGSPSISADGSLNDRIDYLVDRVEKIQAAVDELLRQRTTKDWYSTTEVAKLLGKSDFTVREWCRLGRVHAKKRLCGRGQSQEWIIAHAELQRIRNEGLLPPKD